MLYFAQGSPHPFEPGEVIKLLARGKWQGRRGWRKWCRNTSLPSAFTFPHFSFIFRSEVQTGMVLTSSPWLLVSVSQENHH